MSKPEIPNTTLQVKESLFKRYENLTVFSIFASFVAIVVLVQLITTGGSRFPTFISPINIANILQQEGKLLAGQLLIVHNDRR